MYEAKSCTDLYFYCILKIKCKIEYFLQLFFEYFKGTFMGQRNIQACTSVYVYMCIEEPLVPKRVDYTKNVHKN